MGAQYNKWYAFINDHVIDSALNIRRPFEHRIVARALRLNQNDRVLEIGCNKGKFLTKLIDKAKLDQSKVHGIDVNETGIEYAKHHAKGSYAVMDATRLQFPDASFDKVFMMHVLEHVPDHKATLREACRVIKDDGLLIITLPLDIIRPHLFKASGALCRLLGLHKKALDTSKFSHQVAHYLMNNPHVRIFRLLPLLRDLGEAGFSVDAIHPVCYLPIIPLGHPKPGCVKRQPAFHDLTSYSCTLVMRKKQPDNKQPR